jgi:hypothetical protein
MLRILIVRYRRFGTTHRLILKVEPIGCAETSVPNDQYTLRNIAEERISHLCLTPGINNIHIQVDTTPTLELLTLRKQSIINLKQKMD